MWAEIVLLPPTCVAFVADPPLFWRALAIIAIFSRHKKTPLVVRTKGVYKKVLQTPLVVRTKGVCKAY